MPDGEGGARVPETREVDLDQLATEAQALWRRLPPGSVIWLSGDLGTGKTAFVQALARAAGAQPARSPTFALVHRYASPAGAIAHVDCYRLRSSDEALDLDFPGLVRSSRIVAVEWPERAGSYAPAPDVHLRFAYASDPTHRLLEQVA